MSTLEALEELFAMGFIIEEEYLARRAAFGAPPIDTPATGAQTDATPSNLYDITSAPVECSYSGYGTTDNLVATTQIDLQQDTIPDGLCWSPVGVSDDASQPIQPTQPYTADTSVYTPQYTYPTEPTANLPEIEVGLKSPLDEPAEQQKGDSSNDTALVDASSGGFPDTANKKIEIDVKSFQNLRISPTEDSSSLDAFRSIPPGQAALVQRDSTGYKVHYVDASHYPLSFLMSIGCGDCVLQEVGQWKPKIETDKYWHYEYYKAPEYSQEISAGKTYLIRVQTGEKKGFYGPTYFEPLFSMSWGLQYSPIPDVRLFHDLPRLQSSFDPRQVVEFMKSQYKAEEKIEPTEARFSKLKTVATPAHMYWPLFMHTLRSLQAHMPDEHIHTLPTSSVGIWARIQRCISDGVCYITGESAAYNSFLCPRLHTEEIWNAYTQIQRLKEEQQMDYSTEPESRSYYAPREDEERIVYTDSAKKRSYGWPTQGDLASAPMKTNLGIKSVSAVRKGFVDDLVRELAGLNGPSPLMEA